MHSEWKNGIKMPQFRREASLYMYHARKANTTRIHGTYLIHFAGFAQRLELNVGRDEAQQTLELINRVQLLARGKPGARAQKIHI